MRARSQWTSPTPATPPLFPLRRPQILVIASSSSSTQLSDPPRAARRRRHAPPPPEHYHQCRRRRRHYRYSVNIAFEVNTTRSTHTTQKRFKRREPLSRDPSHKQSVGPSVPSLLPARAGALWRAAGKRLGAGRGGDATVQEQAAEVLEACHGGLRYHVAADGGGRVAP